MSNNRSSSLNMMGRMSGSGMGGSSMNRNSGMMRGGSMSSGGGNFDMNDGDRMMSGGMSNVSSMNRNFNRLKKIDDNPFEQEMEEQDAWSQTMNNRNRLGHMDFRAGGSD